MILLQKLFGNGLEKIKKIFNLFILIVYTNLDRLKKSKRKESGITEGNKNDYLIGSSEGVYPLMEKIILK